MNFDEAIQALQKVEKAESIGDSILIEDFMDQKEKLGNSAKRLKEPQ